MTKAKSQKGLRYVGRGAFLIGIPARDLTPEEVEAYGGRESLLASGLYEEANEKSGMEVEGNARN